MFEMQMNDICKLFQCLNRIVTWYDKTAK